MLNNIPVFASFSPHTKIK